MQEVFWLVVFAILIIIEIATLGLTTIWFAGGALVAWVLALLDVGLPIQVIVFLVVSIVLFIFTRPIALKHFNKQREKTNVDSVIGKDAIVTATIDATHGTGTVIIDGMDWSAKTENPTEVIPVDAVVSVQRVEGVKVIVKQKEA